MHYAYCPLCGSKLTDRPAGDDGNVPYCTSCERYWFDSFASCVIVLTYNEFDEIVLCRQGYMSDRYASLTSGYISPGETAEECALREVKEEIGIDLQTLEYAGSCWFIAKDMLMHGFIGYAPKTPLVLSQEIDSAEWVPALDAPKTVFPERPDSALWMVYRKFLQKRGLPQP